MPSACTVLRRRLEDRIDLIEPRLGEILEAVRGVLDRRRLRPARSESSGASFGSISLNSWNSTSSPAKKSKPGLGELAPARRDRAPASRTAPACRSGNRCRTASSRCRSPTAARGTSSGSATMTKLPAPSISSRPMPPPAANTGNTVRCEVSLASSVDGHGDAGAHRARGLRRHQRLAAQHAVLIAERKAHHFELAPLDLALDRDRGAALLVGPQLVAVDEAQRSRSRGA